DDLLGGRHHRRGRTQAEPLGDDVEDRAPREALVRGRAEEAGGRVARAEGTGGGGEEGGGEEEEGDEDGAGGRRAPGHGCRFAGLTRSIKWCAWMGFRGPSRRRASRAAASSTKSGGDPAPTRGRRRARRAHRRIFRRPCGTGSADSRAS